MKKIFFILILLQSVFIFSQNTLGFPYESTIRNSSNQIVVNQFISLRFTIRLNSNTGTIVYSENQNPYTNTSGNVSLIIGKGVAKTGVFSQINWAQGTHYLGIEFFTGATCQWTPISTGTNGQIVSKCNGSYTYGSCTTNVPNLVWSDEFNGTGAINTSNWFQQSQLPAGNSWYNGELQHYTNRQVNANESNGSLNLVAKKETFTDQGQTKQYTSARLNSKFSFKYGRVEVRAKLPSGAGTWPAIWMLGKNIIEPGAFFSATYGTQSWPACGEVDIMEHWGTNQNYVQSAMHTPSSYGGTVNLGGQTVATASSQFHVYSLDWTSEKMVFSVDNVVHYTYNPPVKNASTWPFDAEQYILLNLAIQSSIISNFTQAAMEVDYVRVYQ
jgi:beta-glucanase (GH16 family)